MQIKWIGAFADRTCVITNTTKRISDRLQHAIHGDVFYLGDDVLGLIMREGDKTRALRLLSLTHLNGVAEMPISAETMPNQAFHRFGA